MSSTTGRPGTVSSWTNWAGTVHSDAVVVHPGSVSELQRVVAAASARGQRIKAIGAGHSFTAIGVTDGVQLRLDRLAGIVHADRTTGLVTVLAGTRLHQLSEWLWPLGLALANLGDIDVQSISGAISTGTHGTGARLGGLATQVRALELVLPDGSLRRCSPDEHPELFAAACVGLGALGIIASVTLQCVPAFALAADEQPAALDAVLAELDAEIAGNDHFEFYWFPHTRRALTKRNNRVLPGTELQPLSPARALSARGYVDRSYRVFASPRRVRFREMEYAVPRDAVPELLAGIEAYLARSGEQIGFPVEVRFAAADELWLSTATGRDTGYVAVHQYHRRDHEPYFRAVEAIAMSLAGRPHWGKIHYRDAESLATVYPHLADVAALRDQLDPQRTFGNAYLQRVLG